MNYHSNDWILKQLQNHFEESLHYFTQNNIVGLFYQGSGNYGLDTENSDVDTKLIVTPTFYQVAMNASPISKTHIRENKEHIDFKDVRSYLYVFRKQNINFLEILFTPFRISNQTYATQWNRLIEAREEIAHINPYRTVKTTLGMAIQKYKNLEHLRPGNQEEIEIFGYDGKELCHLLRLEEFLQRYIAEIPYEKCLITEQRDILIRAKYHQFSIRHAEKLALAALKHIKEMAEHFKIKDKENKETVELLQDVQYNIMKISVLKELEK